jgi:MFS family permease
VAAGMFGMFFGASGFGMIMDYVGTKYPTLISIVIDLVLMILIYFFNGYWSLIVIFLFFNLFAMTAHGSMSKVAREWVRPSRHGLALGFMATSSNVGRIVGLVILGVAYQLGMNWKYSTWIVSGFLAAVFVYYMIIFVLEYTMKKSFAVRKEIKPHPLDGKSLKTVMIYFSTSARFWIALIISGCANSAMDVFSFLPLFVVQTYGVSTGYASIASSVFALGSSISIFAVGWLEDRISKMVRVVLYGVMLTIGALISFGFIWPFGGFYVTTVLLFFLGLMIAPSSYVSYNTFLVNFGGPRAGALYSVVETCGSLTKVGFDLGQGFIIQQYGFKMFWIVSTIVCVVNMVSCVVFLIILARSKEEAERVDHLVAN